MKRIPVFAATAAVTFFVVVIQAPSLVFAQLPPAVGWTNELADGTGDVGYRTGIAIGPLVQIVYEDANGNHAVRYAKRSGNAWTTDVVATSAGSPAIAVDASGNPHLSFLSTGAATPSLVYATRSTTGAFAMTTVDQSSAVLIGESSIAVGANGTVHISYRFGTQLKYASRAAGAATFTTAVVDGLPPLNKVVGRASHIALNAQGLPRISHYSVTDKSLQYAELNGTTWLKDTAAGMVGLDQGSVNALAIDSNGTPHIVYYNSTQHQIKYTTWGPGGRGQWLIASGNSGEVIESNILFGEQLGIALTKNDVPRIAYLAGPGPAFELRSAVRAGSNSWTKQVVDLGGAGHGASLAFDTSGFAHISYGFMIPSSSPTSVLKYAHQIKLPKRCASIRCR